MILVPYPANEKWLAVVLLAAVAGIGPSAGADESGHGDLAPDWAR
jgi:hypothetical protein